MKRFIVGVVGLIIVCLILVAGFGASTRRAAIIARRRMGGRV